MAPEQEQQVALAVFDLVTGERVRGLLVATAAGQQGIVARWPRAFGWNHPVAGVLGEELVRGRRPRWVPVQSLEVVRSHLDPAAGIAFLTFAEDFAADPPAVGEVTDRAAADAIRADTGDWGAVVAAAHPELGSLAEAEVGGPRGRRRVTLPTAELYDAADVVEYLYRRSPPYPWRLCELLHLC